MRISCENFDYDTALGEEKKCRVDYLNHFDAKKKFHEVHEGQSIRFTHLWGEDNRGVKEEDRLLSFQDGSPGSPVARVP